MTRQAVSAPVHAALARLKDGDVIRRIWGKDPTVWRENAAQQGEIRNRLGWLDVASRMLEEAADLEAFADQVRRDGIRHAVLLGMGGSSLCPEVLRTTFGSKHGFPQLLVLDSTVPGTVARVAATVDPARSLFIVSSKSGTTTEPLAFFNFFHELTANKAGKSAGKHFVAITDPGTPLAALGRERGFRRVFLADPDVGGRYSALTHFGIVPAALMGLDLRKLLEQVQGLARSCAPDANIEENPGAVLGALLGAWYQEGADKLTFVTSPKLESFGLWAEQLIAESTGKDGRGILPIAGEPPAGPESYGHDRLFAYLRLEGDANAEADAHVARLSAAGHPVIRRDLADVYDLGAEFYCWEFATAVAGSMIGIHPFDQPNVQESKDNTVRVLAEFEAAGKLPPAPAGGSLAGLLDRAKAGDYLAIMAYVDQTPGTDAALQGLRRLILERRKLPNTCGYGPRFLHSTGQLHKGGKPNGLFLQLAPSSHDDVPIPGQRYGFETLVRAEAIGDFQALQTRSRTVVRIDLERDIPAHLLRLAKEI